MTGSQAVQVMVVDDSAIVRGLLSKILDSDPEISVVATASNGKMALLTLARQDVDVIVLDIEMPMMDGLTALPKLLELKPETKIIMASTLTLKNARVSMQALELGASDYVAKPSNGAAISSTEDFKRELTQKVKQFGRADRSRSGKPAAPVSARASKAEAVPAPYGSAKDIKLRRGLVRQPKAIAIGSSTGGPQALASLFEKLGRSVGLPIFITQHMPPTFTALLAEHLAKVSGLTCAEAKDGEVVTDARVYVAPGGYHMIVERDGASLRTRLTETPPENFCRPSVDPMMRSLIEVYGSGILMIMLTGMGHDGLKGAQALVEAGGTLVAQDQATSVVWGMPGAVATAGLCSAVLPLEEIAPHVLKCTMRTAA